jgi:hypothetical protein
MNSGKTYAAAASCYALSSMGKSVRAAKITGVASLKDISLMDDCGAIESDAQNTSLLMRFCISGIFNNMAVSLWNMPSENSITI